MGKKIPVVKNRVVTSVKLKPTPEQQQEHRRKLKEAVVSYLIPANVTISRLEDLAKISQFKNKAKFHATGLREELSKQENTFTEIWRNDEVNIREIYTAIDDISETIATTSASNIIRIRDVIRELVKNPDFAKMPIQLEPVDIDLVCFKILDSGSLRVWITNKPRLERLKEESSEFEAIVRLEVIEMLENKGMKYNQIDNNLAELEWEDKVYLIENLKLNYSRIKELINLGETIIKPVRYAKKSNA